jgi:hypothetical protein
MQPVSKPGIIPISCYKCSEIMLVDANLGFEMDSKLLCDSCIDKSKVLERDKKLRRILNKKWYERIFN